MKKYNQYINQIVNYKIVHCDKIHRAITRHLNDIDKSVNDASYPYIFDEDKADKAIAFIESLIMYEGNGAGKKLVLEPFQAFIVASLFGWVNKETGLRRFKKSFIFMARGNGKTPLMSAIALLLFIQDKGGQGYSIATNFKQASIVFNWIREYIKSNPKLNERITIYDKSLEYKKNVSVFRPLSKSFISFDGFNPSCIVADEVAAMKDNNLISTMETALFKRPESLLLMITTANFVFDSPGFNEYQYSTKLLSNIIEDERYFALIYELDKDDDWKDYNNYRKANPASFVNLEEFKHECQVAINDPNKERGFRTKNLNQWLTGSANSWLSYKQWEPSIRNYEKYNVYLTEEKLLNYPCSMGLDLSKRDDLTAYTIAWYIADIDKYYLKHKFYIPAPQIEEKLKNDSGLFLNWIEQGYVIATDGPTIDHNRIAEDILFDYDKYKPLQVNYDPALSKDISIKLESAITIMPIIQKPYVLSEPSKDFDEYIKNEKIIDNNPVMSWCVLNTKAEMWHDFLHFVKANKDSTQRIDGVISSTMALMPLKLLNVPAKPTKQYDYSVTWT